MQAMLQRKAGRTAGEGGAAEVVRNEIVNGWMLEHFTVKIALARVVLADAEKKKAGKPSR